MKKKINDDDKCSLEIAECDDEAHNQEQDGEDEGKVHCKGAA